MLNRECTNGLIGYGPDDGVCLPFSRFHACTHSCIWWCGQVVKVRCFESCEVYSRGFESRRWNPQPQANSQLSCPSFRGWSALKTMTYGADAWMTTTSVHQKLWAAQRAMERTMLGITRRDQWRSSRIREMTKVDDAIQTVKKAKWRWVGHMHWVREGRWARSTTQWTPREGRGS